MLLTCRGSCAEDIVERKVQERETAFGLGYWDQIDDLMILRS